MNMKEAFATIRFCINIFYSEANIMIQQLQSNSSDNDESVSHGNFYVNDIKVRTFCVFLYYVPESNGMIGVTRNLFKRVN